LHDRSQDILSRETGGHKHHQGSGKKKESGIARVHGEPSSSVMGADWKEEGNPRANQ
jgi:hypothetical protein